MQEVKIEMNGAPQTKDEILATVYAMLCHELECMDAALAEAVRDGHVPQAAAEEALRELNPFFKQAKEHLLAFAMQQVKNKEKERSQAQPAGQEAGTGVPTRKEVLNTAAMVHRGDASDAFELDDSGPEEGVMLNWVGEETLRAVGVQYANPSMLLAKVKWRAVGAMCGWFAFGVAMGYYIWGATP